MIPKSRLWPAAGAALFIAVLLCSLIGFARAVASAILSLNQ